MLDYLDTFHQTLTDEDMVLTPTWCVECHAPRWSQQVTRYPTCCVCGSANLHDQSLSPGARDDLWRAREDEGGHVSRYPVRDHERARRRALVPLALLQLAGLVLLLLLILHADHFI